VDAAEVDAAEDDAADDDAAEVDAADDDAADDDDDGGDRGRERFMVVAFSFRPARRAASLLRPAPRRARRPRRRSWAGATCAPASLIFHDLPRAAARV